MRQLDYFLRPVPADDEMRGPSGTVPEADRCQLDHSQAGWILPGVEMDGGRAPCDDAQDGRAEQTK